MDFINNHAGYRVHEAVCFSRDNVPFFGRGDDDVCFLDLQLCHGHISSQLTHFHLQVFQCFLEFADNFCSQGFQRSDVDNFELLIFHAPGTHILLIHWNKLRNLFQDTQQRNVCFTSTSRRRDQQILRILESNWVNLSLDSVQMSTLAERRLCKAGYRGDLHPLTFVLACLGRGEDSH